MSRSRRRRPVLMGVSVVCVLIASLVGCAVNQVDWKNGIYTVLCPGVLPHPPQTVHLVNGHSATSLPYHMTLYVDLNNAITTDVTRDGHADEILMLGCSNNGTGWSTEIQIYKDGPTVLARLTAPHVIPSANYPPQFINMWVSGGQLHAAAAYWAPGDPHLFPSIRVWITYRWTGHSFVVSQWNRV